MTKKFLKNRSKRQSCRQKYKVERKVREHLRKVKKEAKKNPKRKKKDPGVPNSLPFKAEVLLEAQNLKSQLLEEKRQLSQAKRDAKLAAKKKKDEENGKDGDQASSLQRLVASAQHRQDAYAKSKAAGDEGGGSLSLAPELLERSAKAFHREFAKVVAGSDVVLEVLDARDPQGSRCREVEESVLAHSNKRLVLVLNKADLVPREVLEAWVAHLRQEFPCLALRCSTQSQKSKIGRSRLAAEAANEAAGMGGVAAGADQLMRLLGNYCRNNGVKTSITVGVVGFPNTGKSSLINTLKRSRACQSGPTPGLTRCSQTVQLDKRIRLLDCPGIVLAGAGQDDGGSDTRLILRNCVRIETVTDPLPAVAAILARCKREQLMVAYSVGEFNDAQEFLVSLAKRMGRLRKGGLPDSAAAGRRILQDWVTGRLTYYTMPQEEQRPANQLKLVADWAKEFDLDSVGLVPDAKALGCKQRDALDSIVQPMEPVAMATENEGEEQREVEDEEMDDEDNDDDNLVVEPNESLKSASGAAAASAAADAKLEAAMAGMQRNRQLRKRQKMAKKKAKRLDKRAGQLGSEFEAKMETVLSSLAEAGDSEKPYNFDEFFPKADK